MKEVPFRRVLLSGLIVDETGDKMSKVKGNVIDPLDLVQGAEFADIANKTLPGAPESEALAKFKKAYPSAAQMGSGFPAFGADALRFTLATFPPSNKRIALALKRIEGNRFFVNKIWQATRFSLEHLAGFTRPIARPEPGGFYNRWILSRLGGALDAAHEGLESFRIDEAAVALYQFFWTDFCSWYVELTKPVFAATGEEALVHETRETLAHVLDASLRALHPLMPFVTEDLWQRLPLPEGHARSIALAPYPTSDTDAKRDPDVDREMATLQAVITAARTVRSEHGLNKPPLPLRIRTDQPALAAELSTHAKAIESQVRTLGPVIVEPSGPDRPPGTVVTAVATDRGTASVKGLVTREEEEARIDRELKRIDKDLAALQRKLGSPGFVDRAPPEVVAEARQQLTALDEARERVVASRALANEL
jgi:valyl-tRNA synthetase